MDYTKGPWEVGDYPNNYTVYGSTGIVGTVDIDVREADLNLILAAPYMYEALKKLLPIVRAEGLRFDTPETSYNPYQNEIYLAEKVLKRAEGRE